MNMLFVYSPKVSARLKYVLDWLFTEQLGLAYTLTTDALQANISYGEALPNTINIPDAGLLWQKGIVQQEIKIGSWQNIPTLYHRPEGASALSFDIFSALFFLLSRYEEYYSFTPDKHGRYPASESVLWNFLDRPIVDEWIAAFAALLKQHNIIPAVKRFSFTVTYDIDIAWSYSNKGWQRNAGGFVKDILKANIPHVIERTRVLTGSNDPYNSFDWLNELHKKYRISPIYFMLVAERTSLFDKNTSPYHPAMRSLIKSLSEKYILGIHPSYNSSIDTALIGNQKNILQNITGKTVTQSRQHYIKFNLPDTYRALIKNNITHDHSMGYATHLGFRAGTGRSFLWYDINEETISALHVHPFCFMDTTARFDMMLDTNTAFERLYKMKEILKRTQSQLVTIFHNFSLGTDKDWKGWQEAYTRFISSL